MYRKNFKQFFKKKGIDIEKGDKQPCKRALEIMFLVAIQIKEREKVPSILT